MSFLNVTAQVASDHPSARRLAHDHHTTARGLAHHRQVGNWRSATDDENVHNTRREAAVDPRSKYRQQILRKLQVNLDTEFGRRLHASKQLVPTVHITATNIKLKTKQLFTNSHSTGRQKAHSKTVNLLRNDSSNSGEETNISSNKFDRTEQYVLRDFVTRDNNADYGDDEVERNFLTKHDIIKKPLREDKYHSLSTTRSPYSGYAISPIEKVLSPSRDVATIAGCVQTHHLKLQTKFQTTKLLASPFHDMMLDKTSIVNSANFLHQLPDDEDANKTTKAFSTFRTANKSPTLTILQVSNIANNDDTYNVNKIGLSGDANTFTPNIPVKPCLPPPLRNNDAHVSHQVEDPPIPKDIEHKQIFGNKKTVGSGSRPYTSKSCRSGRSIAKSISAMSMEAAEAMRLTLEDMKADNTVSDQLHAYTADEEQKFRLSGQGQETSTSEIVTLNYSETMVSDKYNTAISEQVSNENDIAILTQSSHYNQPQVNNYKSTALPQQNGNNQRRVIAHNKNSNNYKTMLNLKMRSLQSNNLTLSKRQLQCIRECSRLTSQFNLGETQKIKQGSQTERLEQSQQVVEMQSTTSGREQNQAKKAAQSRVQSTKSFNSQLSRSNNKTYDWLAPSAGGSNVQGKMTNIHLHVNTEATNIDNQSDILSSASHYRDKRKLASYREKTFEMTLPGYDARYRELARESREQALRQQFIADDDTDEEIKKLAIIKCSEWLSKYTHAKID